jgi:hypothetical protein
MRMRVHQPSLRLIGVLPQQLRGIGGAVGDFAQRRAT